MALREHKRYQFRYTIWKRTLLLQLHPYIVPCNKMHFQMIQPPAIIIADMTESNKMDQNMCDQNQSRKNRPKGTAAIVARSKSAEFPAGFCLANKYEHYLC